MTSAPLGPFLVLLAVVGCAAAPRPIARTGRFDPPVMYPDGVHKDGVGEYESTTVLRPDGTPAPFADVLEVTVPEHDGDPLVLSPAESAAGGFLQDSWRRRPAGTVVERKRADEKGRVFLAFEVGLRACPYAYCDGLAGAGDARAASLIDRPENIYGAELRLAPAIAVAGDVVDEAGAPVRRAAVRIAFRTRRDSEWLVLMTVCDENGAFALPPVPVGEGTEPIMLRADADDGRSARAEVNAADLRAGPMRLVIAGRSRR
jgi:hypothetical protein